MIRVKASLLKYRKLALSSRKFKLGFFLLLFLVCSLSLWPRGEDCLPEAYNISSLRNFQDQVILDSLRKISLPVSFPSSSTWIELYPQLYVYSGYRDTCHKFGPACFKIIGAILFRHSILMEGIQGRCLLKDTNGSVWNAPVSIEVIREHHSRCFRASFFYCNLAQVPPTANITHFYLDFPERSFDIKWLPVSRYDISHKSGNTSQDIRVSVCIRPLFNYFNSPITLSEFISYYQTLGASHFVFYNQSMAPELGVFFSLLRHNSSVSFTLRQWNLPFDTAAIHSEGQLAHVQDCLLYSQGLATHALLVDLDEFIVPRQHNSLPALIADLSHHHPSSGSFVIPNVMFCSEFLHRDTVQLPAYGPALITQLAHLRQASVWSHHERSKPIVALGRVSIGGIHFAWNHTTGWSELKVPPNKATLNHYRACKGMWQHYFLGLLPFRTQDDTLVTDTDVSRRFNLLNSSAILLLHSLWQD